MHRLPATWHGSDTRRGPESALGRRDRRGALIRVKDIHGAPVCDAVVERRHAMTELLDLIAPGLVLAFLSAIVIGLI